MKIKMLFFLQLEKKIVLSDTNYLSVITSWTPDNAKLLRKLKWGFKRTINWKKYQLKASSERQI